MTSVEMVLIALQALVLAAGLIIWLELRRTRTLLENSPLRELRFQKPSVPTINAGGRPIAFVIWVWRGRVWKLDQAAIPHGFHAGEPPGFEGTFEGQRVKTECLKESQ